MRRLVWILTAVLGLLIIVAVVVYVVRVGLDESDKLASVIGALFGAASFALGAIQFVRSGPPGAPSAQFTNTKNTIGKMTQAHTINGPIDVSRD